MEKIEDCSKIEKKISAVEKQIESNHNNNNNFLSPFSFFFLFYIHTHLYVHVRNWLS